MKTVKALRGLSLFLVSLTPVLGTSVLADVADKSSASTTIAVSETGAVLPAKSLDDKINAFIEPATKQIGEIVFWTVPIGGQDVPFVLIWLVVGAIVFTLYFRFINIRGFKLSLDIVRGKYTDPREKGEVSHFQALTAALSGTVGLGNIAGVAVAISLGGPGATFWMIVAGLLGMSAKFVECTLGVKYRQIDETGKTYGGPMYYLSQGFAEKGLAGLGKVLAVFFAIMCIGGALGGGNMFQINQAYTQFIGVTGGESSWWSGKGWFFGLIIAVVVGLVIIGGIRSIARTTSRIVPFMCGIYVTAAVVILLSHAGQIPTAIGDIFRGAFSGNAIAGGVIGVMIQGFKRAAFSNEAGIGSASIAHSAVRTENPASEGLVSLLEPFIDTVVVCTMTALVIVITDQSGATTTAEGVTITSAAFASVIAWFPYILTVAVILFAFSTMIAWSYYGEQSWIYLFGRSEKSRLVFKFIFCFFIVVGAAMSLKNVIGFSDAMIFAMCFPNVIGLYVLMPKVRKELDSYMKKIEDGTIKRRD
uniref:Na+/alanine symporter n=1 Tax=uncultured verrucomicrobium HF0500_27H16 TaxID=723600 RepID=E7C5L0_9BACT|nr:Na+/alanine symporter [uncultured verrucomicrobium HF0500_27H16]